MRFVRAFLGAAAVLFLSYGTAIRIVDPRNDFGTGIFPTLTSNSRLDKMELFLRLHADQPVQGLVLGSSRVMKITPEALTHASGLRFFNFGVDSARAEDYLAIYRWVRAHGAPLELLLIGLDVEALHDDDRADAEFSKSSALRHALDGQAAYRATLETYKQIFTPGYAEDAVRSVVLFGSTPRQPRFYFERDGSLHDLTPVEHRWHGEVSDAGALTYCLDTYAARFRGMTALSARRRRYVELTLQEARAAGVRIVVWITPLHPVTAQYLTTRTDYARLLAKTRAFLNLLGERPNVITYDYSDPRLYEGSLTDWDDCAHTGETQAALLAARLTRQLP